MTKSPPRDVGASVRARLLRLAQATGDDFQSLLTRYANERVLHRLAASRHRNDFVLKGAALFTAWTGKPHRATRDLDLLGIGDPGTASIRETFRELLASKVPDDGVRFEPNDLEVAPIRNDRPNGGVRAEFVASIASARVRLQVDVGFGDAITPAAEEIEFPSLLDFPKPHLRAYPRETVVAEKAEAMVQLGLANSRMKDFYDVLVLARDYDFEGELLVRALRATFDRRGTALPRLPPMAFTATFAEDPMKVTQWAGFKRKAGVRDVGTLAETVEAVRSFLEAPLFAAATDSKVPAVWRGGGGWET